MENHEHDEHYYFLPPDARYRLRSAGVSNHPGEKMVRMHGTAGLNSR